MSFLNFLILVLINKLLKIQKIIQRGRIIPSKEELRNFITQSKLNERELEEFLNATKNMNPKLDHSLAYRTMMSEIRRDLLKYIGNEIRDIKDIQEEFQIGKDQLIYHLSMLRQGLYVIDSNSKWKATPRGLGFLANAVLG